jgi:hypothetical protein
VTFPDQVKTDYNDLLKTEGIQAVQSKVEQSVKKEKFDLEHAIQRFELPENSKSSQVNNLQEMTVHSSSSDSLRKQQQADCQRKAEHLYI